jgi:ssDNA-binding replication factor A large subunit
LVSDNGEEVRLTLWHSDVKKFFEQGFERGDLIKAMNCNVTKFNDKLQLSLFNEGKIELIKEAKTERKKVKQLKPGMVDVDLLLKIQRIFEEREFESKERKGKLISFIGEDTSGTIRGTAWNELTEVMHRVPIGKTVLIEGAYTKEGMQGTELHLGWQSRILLNPRESKEATELNELVKKIERKKFNEVKDGEFFEERGTIVDLMKGNLFYLSCNCGRKALQGEKGFECSKCGKTEPKPKAVVSAMIDDGFECLRTSFFGKEAEKLLEKKAEEIEAMNEDEKQEFIEQKKNELTGKEIIIQAKARKNPNSNEMELSVSRFQETEALKEAKERLKEAA